VAIHTLEYFVRVDDQELKGLRGEANRLAKSLGLIGPETAKASGVAGAALQGLDQKTRQAATARIAADAKIRKGLQQQLVVYEHVARTATKGSAEQVAAANNADRVMRRLGIDGEIAGRRIGVGSHRAERELSRVTRGALAASGALRGIGRGALIGGFSFIAGAGIISTLRRIFTDSEDVVQSQKQLDTQLAASEISAGKYRAQIDKVVSSQARLAKVDEEDVKRALTTEVRATGDLRESYGLVALALDLAAAKHLDLAAAAQIEAKVATGNVGILRRQGIAITKNATVTQALRQEQKQLAGQAVATANTAGGAFRGFGLAVENVREALGEGLLPVLEQDLNAIADKLNDPATQAAVREFAERLSHDVEGALHDIADFFQEHWPEIRRDFKEGADDVKFLADRLGELLGILDKIAHVVPDSDSLIKLLLLGGAVRKLGGVGKPAAAAAEKGGGSKLLESSIIADLVERVASKRRASDVVGRTLEAAGAEVPRSAKLSASLPEILKGGGRLARFARLGTVTILLDLALSKKDRHDFFDVPNQLSFNINKKIGVPERGLLGQFFAKQSNATGIKGFFAHQVLGIPTEAQRKLKEQVDKAITDGGTDGSEKAAGVLERKIIESATTAAQNLRDKLAGALDTNLKTVSDKALQAFDGATDTLLNSFDRQTDAILNAFDEQTRKLEDKLVVSVKVPSLNETFKVSVQGKTPAERELDALDKLGAKRHANRDLQDANEELAQARAIGDPKAIEDALRKREDAQAELKRIALEKRAKTERAAADKALAAGKDRIDKQRGIERQSLEDQRASYRRDLDARRQLEREHFQTTLAALTKELETGKLTAGQAQQKILAVLAKYGVSYKQAGLDLGKAFATGLGDAIDKATAKAGRLHDTIVKLANLKKKIGDLAKSVDDLAAGLSKAGGAFVATPALAKLLGVQDKNQPGTAPAPGSPAGIAAVDTQAKHDEKIRAHAEARAGQPTRRAILNALHRINAPAFYDRLVPKRGEPTHREYESFLGRLDDPTRRLLRQALKQQGFFRARHGGVAPGDGRPDTTLSLLTRGEVVLTDDDQRRLKQALGIGGGPHELLAGIRHLPRFANGGVVPGGDGVSIDDLVRMLIEQLAGQEVAHSRATKLHGRPVPHPLHIAQLIAKNPQLDALPETKKLALEERLAQLQAHPVLFGLATSHPDGPETLGPAGRTGRVVRRRPPVEPIPSGAFTAAAASTQEVTIHNVIELDGAVVGRNTRKHLIRTANRNGRRIGRRSTLGDKAPRLGDFDGGTP
jgi:hypothetical protein